MGDKIESKKIAKEAGVSVEISFDNLFENRNAINFISIRCKHFGGKAAVKYQLRKNKKQTGVTLIYTEWNTKVKNLSNFFSTFQNELQHLSNTIER